MGLMTPAEVEAEVRYLLENDLDETQERVRLWIRFGYDFITAPNVYEHPELEDDELLALVAGTNVLATSITWARIDSVRFCDAPMASVTPETYGWRLRPTSERMLRSRSQLTQGQPRRYAFFQNELHFDRMIVASDAGKGIAVAGFRKPVALDFAMTLLPSGAYAPLSPLRSEWDQLLCLAAAMYGFVWKGLPEQAFNTRDVLARLINEMPRIQDMSAADFNDQMQLVTAGMRRGR
jgi:hypothetical protein